MTPHINETPRLLVLSSGKVCYDPFEYRWGQWQMAVPLRVKEVACEKGMSMGKLQRDADVAYNTELSTR